MELEEAISKVNKDIKEFTEDEPIAITPKECGTDCINFPNPNHSSDVKELALQSWDSHDQSVWLFKNSYVHVDNGEFRINKTKAETLGEIIAEWDLGSWNDSMSVCFKEFGLDQEAEDSLDIPGEDYIGEVFVWCRRYFYAGHLGLRHDGQVLDERGEQLSFESAAVAQKWVDKQESGAYILMHGEYTRPTYTIFI